MSQKPPSEGRLAVSLSLQLERKSANCQVSDQVNARHSDAVARCEARKKEPSATLVPIKGIPSNGENLETTAILCVSIVKMCQIDIPCLPRGCTENGPRSSVAGVALGHSNVNRRVVPEGVPSCRSVNPTTHSRCDLPGILAKFTPSDLLSGTIV